MEGSEIHKAIDLKARDSEMMRSEPWCDLRHYLGRWHSYRQAAEIITKASQRWPTLFQDYEFLMLPCSEKMTKPINKSDLTAALILENMAAAEHKTTTALLQHAQEAQKFDLDQAIQLQVSKSKFEPIIHAEIIVHTHLVNNGLTSEFWNGLNYIGSSKPTCRLCSYYFESHQHDRVEVRPSHFNLYPSWRLPDYPAEHEPEARKIYDDMFLRITQKIRNDVKRSLEQKITWGKSHDSNTYSTMPDYLREGCQSSDADTDSSQSI